MNFQGTFLQISVYSLKSQTNGRKPELDRGPICPSSCKMATVQGHFLASYFRVFDIILCGLPGVSYSINGCLPLALTSFLLSHPLTPPLTHSLTLFSPLSPILVSTPDIHIRACTP